LKYQIIRKKKGLLLLDVLTAEKKVILQENAQEVQEEEEEEEIGEGEIEDEEDATEGDATVEILTIRNAIIAEDEVILLGIATTIRGRKTTVSQEELDPDLMTGRRGKEDHPAQKATAHLRKDQEKTRRREVLALSQVVLP